MEHQHIAMLLPEIFQRTLPEQWWQELAAEEPGTGSVLGAFLFVMETMHAPEEDILEKLDMNFDPLKAPDEWLPYLASWLDLDRFLKPDGEEKNWIFPGGSQRLRLLMIEAVSLSKERGTYPGLQRFLRIATGIDGIKVKPAEGKPFHIIVTYPDLQDYGMDDSVQQGKFISWFAELVDAEKPAYVTREIRQEQ